MKSSDLSLHPGLFVAAAAYPLWFAIVVMLDVDAAPLRAWGYGFAVELVVLLVGVPLVRRLGTSTERRRIIRSSVMVLILGTSAVAVHLYQQHSMTWCVALLAGLFGVGLSASEKKPAWQPPKPVLALVVCIWIGGIALSMTGSGLDSRWYSVAAAGAFVAASFLAVRRQKA